jgi:hypothetical protein
VSNLQVPKSVVVRAGILVNIIASLLFLYSYSPTLISAITCKRTIPFPKESRRYIFFPFLLSYFIVSKIARIKPWLVSDFQ